MPKLIYKFICCQLTYNLTSSGYRLLGVKVKFLLSFILLGVFMDFPVLFINFKCYEQATAKKAVALARAAEEAALSEHASVSLVPQAVDLASVVSAVSLPVFAQHVDPVTYGSHTGHALPEAFAQAGAVGTVLNHAENKRDNAFLEKAIERAKDVGLKVMACAESTERAVQIASFQVKPDLIAIEPPELIGGNVSVSSARPGLITETIKAVEAIASIPIITGAGIKSSEDVKIALKLGTKGVFVASGIVKAEDQGKAIRALIEGFG